MGLGSKLKNTFKRVAKEAGRGFERTGKQLERSLNDFADIAIQAPTLGTVGVGDDWKMKSGEVVGKAATEIRDNWTKWRTPLLIGAGTAIAATGIGAGIGAGIAAAGIGTASTIGAGATSGAITGAISGTVAGGVGAATTANTQHNERVAEAEAEEYAIEVERQKRSFELAAAIQSQTAQTVNPSAYYNIYSKYGRGGIR